MIKRAIHVGISVVDIDRSISFYRDVLGMQLLRRAEMENRISYDSIFGLKNVRAKSAMLSLGNMELELWEFERPRGQPGSEFQPVNDPRITHICFEVDDIQKEYERMSASGVRFHCEPQEFGSARAVYGRDPDGNMFELVQW